jgi:archaemetzincin
VKHTTSEVLGVVQVGLTSDYPLELVKDQLSEQLPSFRYEATPPLADMSEAYDSRRGQYHSTRLLVLLEEHLRTLPVDRLLGVTALDIYVPGMNFVFGEARCPGRVALISTKRLAATPRKQQRFRDRVLKEAVHEIGHTLGLMHCPDTSCVMHFSEHIGDTDKKTASFCEDCQSSLKRAKS